MLPDASLGALGRMMGEWDDTGAWPETPRQVIYSMMPKAKAENEAGLRPIGLLPYVIRVWLAIRKTRMHSGSGLSAYTMAGMRVQLH